MTLTKKKIWLRVLGRLHARLQETGPCWIDEKYPDVMKYYRRFAGRGLDCRFVEQALTEVLRKETEGAAEPIRAFLAG